jgi:hypothetical protein
MFVMSTFVEVPNVVVFKQLGEQLSQQISVVSLTPFR